MHTAHFNSTVPEVDLCTTSDIRKWDDILATIGIMPRKNTGNVIGYYSALEQLYITLTSQNKELIFDALVKTDKAATGVIVGNKSVQTMFPCKELIRASETFSTDDWLLLMERSQAHLSGLIGFLAPFMVNQ